MNTLCNSDFIKAAQSFVEISNKICDDWKFIEDEKDCSGRYLRKETFLNYKNDGNDCLLKAEYVIFYKQSYGVPSFSFNIWNSSGVLLTLDEIRKLSLIRIPEKDFYSVITQQEHPIFHRPYFIVHPCHTEALLDIFKNRTKNIIVTFLGFITPLLGITLPLEYGL